MSQDENSHDLNSSSDSNEEEKNTPKPDQPDSIKSPASDDQKGSDEKPIDDLLKTMNSMLGLLGRVVPSIMEGLGNLKSGDTYYQFTNSHISQSAIGTNPTQKIEGGSNKTRDAQEAVSESETEVDWLKWFMEKKLQDQAFIVSLLFFSGNSPAFVINATTKLVRFIDVEHKSANSSIFEKGIPISSFIQDGLAHVAQESINTEAGKLYFESISFKNDEIRLAFQRIILKNRDLISFRSTIREWLTTIIKSDDNKLQKLGSLTPDLPRVQSGLGLGSLARSELDNLPLVIKPWASSENPNDRLMVGWMLLGYFEEDVADNYWSNVSSLLKHWASIDNYYLRWTAIASTTRLGLIVSPEDDTSLVLSMSIFKEICKSGQTSMFRRTFRSVLLKSLRFLFSLSSYHARGIIIELASWINDQEHIHVQDTSAELFIELIDVTISVDSEDSTSKGISVWKLCVTESYTLGEAVHRLIYRALTHQKGVFVDYTTDQLSKSLQKFLERDHNTQKAITNIFSQLRDDKLTEKYVSLILGNYQERI